MPRIKLIKKRLFAFTNKFLPKTEIYVFPRNGPSNSKVTASFNFGNSAARKTEKELTEAEYGQFRRSPKRVLDEIISGLSQQITPKELRAGRILGSGAVRHWLLTKHLKKQAEIFAGLTSATQRVFEDKDPQSTDALEALLSQMRLVARKYVLVDRDLFPRRGVSLSEHIAIGLSGTQYRVVDINMELVSSVFEYLERTNSTRLKGFPNVAWIPFDGYSPVIRVKKNLPDKPEFVYTVTFDTHADGNFSGINLAQVLSEGEGLNMNITWQKGIFTYEELQIAIKERLKVYEKALQQGCFKEDSKLRNLNIELKSVSAATGVCKYQVRTASIPAKVSKCFLFCRKLLAKFLKEALKKSEQKKKNSKY